MVRCPSLSSQKLSPFTGGSRVGRGKRGIWEGRGSGWGRGVGPTTSTSPKTSPSTVCVKGRVSVHLFLIFRFKVSHVIPKNVTLYRKGNFALEKEKQVNHIPRVRPARAPRLNLKCEAIPRRARIQGSQTFVSLNSSLESNKEEEEKSLALDQLQNRACRVLPSPVAVD